MLSKLSAALLAAVSIAVEKKNWTILQSCDRSSLQVALTFCASDLLVLVQEKVPVSQLCTFR